MLEDMIMREQPKLARNGALVPTGYVQKSRTFRQWLSKVVSWGLDVIIVCHAKEAEVRGALQWRLDMSGASAQILQTRAAAMGLLTFVNGKRTLDFRPIDGFGKNPAELPPLEVPHWQENPHFMSKVMDMIRHNIVERNRERLAMFKNADNWDEQIKSITTHEEMTELAMELNQKKAPAHVRRNLIARATAMGFTWDKEQNAFVKKVIKGENHVAYQGEVTIV